jgi:hypothetical protein
MIDAKKKSVKYANLPFIGVIATIAKEATAAAK